MISTIFRTRAIDAGSDNYVSVYLDSATYWVLVRVARRFVIPNAKAVFIRTRRGTNKFESLLPNGQCHSVGMASRSNHLHQQWCRDGILHRSGAPAVIFANKSQLWYENGYRRAGLPFLIKGDGCQSWVTRVEHAPTRSFEFSDDLELIISVGSTLNINECGQRFYGRGIQKHRLGLPAEISAYGSQYWYADGKLHREGLPACIYYDGCQDWFVNNEIVISCEIRAICATWIEEWHSRGLCMELTAADLTGLFPNNDEGDGY